MNHDSGADAASALASLQAAGLMPPVVGLHVVDDPGSDGEVLVIEVLQPCREDVATEVARTLHDVRYELHYVAFDEDGRRPGVTYRADFSG